GPADESAEARDQDLEQVVEELSVESHNARTLTLPDDGRLDQDVLAEVEKGYDLVVIGTGALRSSEHSLREPNGSAGPALRRWLPRWARSPGTRGPAQPSALGHEAGYPEQPQKDSPFQGPLFSELVDQLIHHAP